MMPEKTWLPHVGDAESDNRFTLPAELLNQLAEMPEPLRALQEFRDALTPEALEMLRVLIEETLP